MILTDLKKSLFTDIELIEEGPGRYSIDTPYGFKDGDSYVIILKKINDTWQLSDEGHTLMHLSYNHSDNRDQFEETFNSALNNHNIINNNGELILKVTDDKIGDALLTFIRALEKLK